ncbi:ABC transporter substrate-binding protein [Agrobacterium sp. ICMP 7243]|nr:ABC transporter substrate-binding protein [Agrobacterium sp. ICMP 7243]NTG17166.1 ABC transporter substrate-binding protein [Rhizobium rhizogenes]NTG23829.1 ABC transporter substrate-binding protein [Rhizobium rhizogenes]NTG30771.1 ABC transporter substrate-binding protein [Rhizobium rhizogenes]NTH41230.1 ABC transporter substrate-binding protein [Rhizobium rhizogenes]
MRLAFDYLSSVLVEEQRPAAPRVARFGSMMSLLGATSRIWSIKSPRVSIKQKWKRAMLFSTATAFFGAASLYATLESAAAEQPKSISVIAFPSPHSWPIWAAQEKGYFDRNGIAVTLTPTPNSEFLMTGLVDGRFDIAMAGIDNVIAYMEGQGEAPTKEKPDIIAFMGAGNDGFLQLVTVPEVKSYADLKGKQLSVDAVTTGYAFVLRKLLEKGGLKFSDVEFVSVGGLQQRFQALMKKQQAGTLLISPMQAAAQARGFNLLANADDVLDRYQGTAFSVRRSWAKDNEAALVGYVRAYLAALDWLYEPANKAEAIAILRRNMPNMSETFADVTYEILLHPEKGINRTGDLDITGIKTVLALRSEYGEPRKTLTDVEKYYDLQYLAKAAGLPRQPTNP